MPSQIIERDLLTVLSMNGKTSDSGYISLKDEILNALILSGVAFFSSLYVSNDSLISLKIALIQAGLAFFTRLASSRGLDTSGRKGNR